MTNAYTKKEKAIKCLENNIDVMIDDSVGNCKSCIENNIKTFLMDAPYNRFADIPRVNNWKEFYEAISNMKKKKVILDTDMFNKSEYKDIV